MAPGYPYPPDKPRDEDSTPSRLTDKHIEGLRWLVDTCKGEVWMLPIVPMYPIMEALFEAGLVGRRLPEFPNERTLWEACDPAAKTVIALYDRLSAPLSGPYEHVAEIIAAHRRELVESRKCYSAFAGEDSAKRYYQLCRTISELDVLAERIERAKPAAPLSETAKENGVSDDPPKRDKAGEVSDAFLAHEPNGTIFEVDLFRERLLRLAADWRRAPKPRPWSEYDRALDRCGSIIEDRATELDGLIDNLMAQYGPNGWLTVHWKQIIADQKPAPLPVSDGGLAAARAHRSCDARYVTWLDDEQWRVLDLLFNEPVGPLHLDDENAAKFHRDRFNKLDSERLAANQSTHPVSDGVREALWATVDSLETLQMASAQDRTDRWPDLDTQAVNEKVTHMISVLAAALALPVRVQAEDGLAALTGPGRDKADASSEASAAAGVWLIATERQRQMTAKGYDPAHDDEHTDNSIRRAAMAYIKWAGHDTTALPYASGWPWVDGWKPTGDPVRDLTKAGALIAAEIDRLNRAATTPTVSERGEDDRG